MNTPTIAEALTEGAALLVDSDPGNERRAAKTLLGHALGLNATQIISRATEHLETADYDRYIGFLRRRIANEPIQYITGHREFYGLDFIVNPDVLIPRPETEFLVEQVLKLARENDLTEPLVVDIGTGSGCIAVAIAANLPAASVIATDISAAALAVAHANAKANGATRVEFFEADMLQGFVERGLAGKIDFIATNPPYIPADRPELLQAQVREYEPGVALYAGSLGMDYYRLLLGQAHLFLKPGGYIVCEMGYRQLDAFRELIQEPWREVEVTHDLQGFPRVITLQKASSSPG